MADPLFTIIDGYFMTGIVFVFVAGFLIGFERGSRGEPAGVRTHTLVCFGAMLFTLISQYVDPLSPSRIAANVVTGMGFLGAGIIMHNRGSVKGLTTAATLWLTAAIGVAIGYGFYVVAVLATLSAFVILKLPHIGEEGFKPESTYLSTALKPDKPPSSTRKKTILKKEGGKKR